VEAGSHLAGSIRDAVTPRVARATMQEASAADVTGLLPAVAAPALVLHRRGMPQISADIARSLAAGLPRGQLVMLEGSQPSLFVENPDQVARLLLSFCGPRGATAEGTAVEVTAAGPAARPAAGAMATGPAAARAARPGGLSGREVEVLVDLKSGPYDGTIWTNDLTHAYVHENSAYST
jgi:hypothetical protein